MNAQSPCKVLIVEDDPTNALLTHSAVSLGGGDPICVDNGQESIDAFLSQSGCRLILMDVQMPVMDGLAATRAIRIEEKVRGRIPTLIVGLTARAMPHEIEQCMSSGMDRVITKPFSIKDLVEVVRSSAR